MLLSHQYLHSEAQIQQFPYSAYYLLPYLQLINEFLKKILSNRQCISFYATGCHFTGPVALRPRLSSGLPIILLKLLKSYKKINFIILPHSTLHKKNITVLTFKNKKRTVDTYTELFSYFRSPRSIDITVSCSFVLRSFHIPRTSFCSSVRFSE